MPSEGARERFLRECAFRGRENHKLQFAVLTADGVEPDLLEEVAAGQIDDFWQYALFAAVAYTRIAADRAGVPVRQVCQELTQRPGPRSGWPSDRAAASVTTERRVIVAPLGEAPSDRGRRRPPRPRCLIPCHSVSPVALPGRTKPCFYYTTYYSIRNAKALSPTGKGAAGRWARAVGTAASRGAVIASAGARISRSWQPDAGKATGGPGLTLGSVRSG